VCANVLGGCQGTTGPASVDPATGRPYASRFPIVSIRDIVRTQAALADHLAIDTWLSVIGGSMGGMQVLEWGVMFPRRVRSIVPISTCAAATAQQIAYSTVQRNAIALDPKWRGGEYYDAAPGDGPHLGLATARQLAHITYRTDQIFGERFDRGALEATDQFTLWQRFDVEQYLDYQGAKLARRFDANSCLIICKAMDLHDIGRGRGGIARALARVTAPTLTMSIDSDALFYPYQQQQIHDGIVDAGGQCEHVTIESPDGHDGFLLATDEIAAALRPFLDEVEKTDG
jgi:homoserine O-acetyltransferase